jgi:hypothetical protein
LTSEEIFPHIDIQVIREEVEKQSLSVSEAQLVDTVITALLTKSANNPEEVVFDITTDEKEKTFARQLNVEAAVSRLLDVFPECEPSVRIEK